MVSLSFGSILNLKKILKQNYFRESLYKMVIFVEAFVRFIDWLEVLYLYFLVEIYSIEPTCVIDSKFLLWLREPNVDLAVTFDQEFLVAIALRLFLADDELNSNIPRIFEQSMIQIPIRSIYSLAKAACQG